MAAEDILKYLNLIVDGRGYAGKIEEYSPPDLTVSTEEFRGGGMDQAIDIDMGQEKMTCSFVLTSYDADVLALWGVKDGSTVQLTARGSLESLDGATTAVAHHMQGKMISVTAEITFANVSPLSRFTMPEPGAEVEIELGYLGKFKHMGVYIADEVEENSPPRAITVICRAKAQGETQSGYAPIHQQKTRSWEDGLTVEDIASTIAGDNGLDPGVTESAASIVPGHIDQIDESDLSVLTRIAVAHDLIAKPAGGVLFVGKKAEGLKASGQPTPTITLWEADVTRWAMRRSLGEATGTVIATYRDLEAGKDEEVKVGRSTLARTTYDDKQICHVEVTRANKPVYVISEGKEEFFVRKEGSSQPLSRAEEHEWNKGRF